MTISNIRTALRLQGVLSKRSEFDAVAQAAVVSGYY